MGISGSGKTTVGRALAGVLGWTLYDGDDFHPPANVDKMSRGLPLTDAERYPWLATLHDLSAACLASGHSIFAPPPRLYASAGEPPLTHDDTGCRAWNRYSTCCQDNARRRVALCRLSAPQPHGSDGCEPVLHGVWSPQADTVSTMRGWNGLGGSILCRMRHLAHQRTSNRGRNPLDSIGLGLTWRHRIGCGVATPDGAVL
jgi:hypothetical protein